MVAARLCEEVAAFGAGRASRGEASEAELVLRVGLAGPAPRDAQTPSVPLLRRAETRARGLAPSPETSRG